MPKKSFSKSLKRNEKRQRNYIPVVVVLQKILRSTGTILPGLQCSTLEILGFEPFKSKSQASSSIKIMIFDEIFRHGPESNYESCFTPMVSLNILMNYGFMFLPLLLNTISILILFYFIALFF